jgi:hypothetical protein
MGDAHGSVMRGLDETARPTRAASCDADNREISRKTAPANGATDRYRCT